MSINGSTIAIARMFKRPAWMVAFCFNPIDLRAERVLLMGASIRCCRGNDNRRKLTTELDSLHQFVEHRGRSLVASPHRHG